MTDFPAAGYISNSTRTEGEVKAALEAIIAAAKQLPGGNVEEALTIATGSITPTVAVFTVDTEGSASTDDLTNIAQTNLPDGSIIMLTPVNTAHKVVVKNNAGGTGAILLADGVDLTMDSTQMWLYLKRVGSSWEEIHRQYGDRKSAFRTYWEMDWASVTISSGASPIGATHRGKLVKLNGTFSISISAASNLGNYLTGLRNIGSGVITINRSASDLIDGATSLILQAGDSSFLEGDGVSAFSTVGLSRATPAAGSVSVQAGTTHSPTGADNGKTFVYTNGAGCTVSLPSIAAVGEGYEIGILNKSGADVTINRNGTDIIDPAATAIKTQNFDGGNQNRLKVLNGVWYTTRPRHFRSAQQTITNAGLLTLAHGLGGKPDSLEFHLVCQTADDGYTVGDEVNIGATPADFGSVGGYGVSCVPDTTNISIRYGVSGQIITQKASGSTNVVTNANYRAVFLATYF